MKAKEKQEKEEVSERRYFLNYPSFFFGKYVLFKKIIGKRKKNQISNCNYNRIMQAFSIIQFLKMNNNYL